MTIPTALPAARGEITALHSAPLTGAVTVGGERALAHRAVALASLALGETRIDEFPGAADIGLTLAAMRALGAEATFEAPTRLRIRGLGIGGLIEPRGILACGSSSETLTILLGLLASQGFAATLSGEGTLAALDNGPLLEALRRVGADVISRSRGRLPLSIAGAAMPLPIDERIGPGAARIKTALLLATLGCPGVSTLTESPAMADGGEGLLAAFGAAIEIERDAEAARRIIIEGGRALRPQTLTLPGDPLLAGFAIVAGLIVPDSQITLRRVLADPARTALVDTLIDMGADITITARGATPCGPVADFTIRSSRLAGTRVPAARAGLLRSDDAALLAAAAAAKGVTTIEGLGTQRPGPGERRGALIAAFRAAGVAIEDGPESLVVTGALPRTAARVGIDDPTIAAALLTLGLATPHGITLDETAPLRQSFPGFLAMLTDLGARFETRGT